MPKEKYIEKECKNHGKTRYVLEGSGYYRCIKCRSANVTKRRTKLRRMLVDHFGGKCLVCSYDKCIANLNFHHLDPTKKDFGISSKGLTRSYDKLLEEASKCVLVCNRCHGEIHSNIIDIGKWRN